jgi:hypothetical protein
VLSSIILLLSAFSSQALTPQTTHNVINGSAPYLTFDGGRTRATNVDELLAITLSDGTRIMPSTNKSSLIQLPNASDNLSDVVMSVPVGANSVALSTLIGPPNNYWADDDGDGDFTITGEVMLSIADKNGNAIDRRDTLDICKAPYKVTLESSGGELRTRYGVPNHNDFSPSSATYYIKPKASSGVCFVRPNLQYGSSSDYFRYRGPSTIWNPDKGFLVQSTDPLNYDKNFPATGSNNLYFYLDIGGVDPSALSWPSVTHSGITASMRVVPPNPSADLHSFDRLGGLRVTLTGPAATSVQVNSSSPSNIPRPALPATFELVGQDSSGRAVIKYGFELKQWFVNRGSKADTVPNQVSWCSRIGYQLARVRDLTNAQCTGFDSSYYCQGSVGATPSSSGNHYQRRINAGFFSEWGRISDYTGASFASDNYYWTSEETADSEQFEVRSYDGYITSYIRNYSYSAVCTSSLRS